MPSADGGETIMCLGGDDPQDTPAARDAAAAEKSRQGRIDEGMRQIERMFGGGQVGTGLVKPGTTYDPNQAYYLGGGEQWHMDPAAAQQRIDAARTRPLDNPEWMMTPEQMQQQIFNESTAATPIYTGQETTTGYGDEFFNKAYQAQLDYALPQVDRQFQDAQRELQFALARQGLSQSSQAGQLQANLERDRQLAVQTEQDKANTVRQKQRQAVEDERSNLVSMLQSTGDVESTMNTAAARKGMIEAAPAIEEVAPYFQNATASLADMIVSPALRQNAGRSGPSYAYSGQGSGKVVGS